MAKGTEIKIRFEVIQRSNGLEDISVKESTVIDVNEEDVTAMEFAEAIVSSAICMGYSDKAMGAALQNAIAVYGICPEPQE